MNKAHGFHENDVEVVKGKIIGNRRDGVELCRDCGSNHFRTIEKGRAWQCRHCGHVRGSLSRAKQEQLKQEMEATNAQS